MPVVQLPRREKVRRKPPLGAVVDWTHPLAKNLAGCWLLNEPPGVSAKDIAGSTTLASNGIFVQDKDVFTGGPALAFGNPAGSTVGQYFDGGNAVRLGWSGDVTVACLFKTTDNTSNVMALAGKGFLGGPPNGGYGLFVDNTHVTGWQVRNAAQTSNVLGTTDPRDGKWHLAMGTRALGVSRVFLDGKLEGSDSTAVTVANDPLYNFSIGARHITTIPVWGFGWPGSIGFVYVWMGRALTVEDARRLWFDPYAFIRNPSTPRVYYFQTELLNYTLTAATGALALSGNDVGLYRGLQVTAAQGSMTLTGNAAGVAVTAHRLACAKGEMSLTGNTAGLGNGRHVTAESSTMFLTGNDAGLYVGYKATCEAGVMTLTGVNAGGHIGIGMPVDTGALTLTGQAATLKATRKISCAAGSMSLTGLPAAFPTAQRVLVAATGSLTLTGNAVTSLRTAKAATGALTLTGNPASLIYVASGSTSRSPFKSRIFQSRIIGGKA